MGFLGLRRPGWKHADAEVRLAAVPELAESAQSTFIALATHDADARVRAAAAARVREPEALTRLAATGDPAVARIARERLGAAAGRLLKHQPLATAAPALEACSDQKTLSSLVLTATDPAVRAAALTRLLALPSPSPALLATVAIQDAAGEHGLRALGGIARRATLRDIARKAKAEAVRAAAQARLEAQVAVAERPSTERQRAARAKAIAQVLEQATRLAVSSDAIAAAAELPGVVERWQAALALAPELPLEPGTTEQAARWQRLQAEIERAAAQERDRRAQVLARREELLRDAAQPSSPEERARLLQAWQTAGALPTALLQPLEERWRALTTAARPAEAASVPVAAVDPLPPAQAEELAAIGAAAEELSGTDAFLDALPRWHQLHKRWLRASAGAPGTDPRVARFLDAYAHFKQRRRDARTARQQARTAAAEHLTTLLAQAQALAQEAATIDALAPDQHQAVQALGARVRALQAAWKQGAALAGAQARSLRERFHAACDAAYAPVALTREAEDWERLRHLAQAEELVAQVEGLATLEDLAQVLDAVKQAHRAWKQLGPLPRDRQQAVWQRFHAACDAQYERCRPFLAQEQARREEGLARKRTLLAEVRELAAAPTIGLPGSPADLAAGRTQLARLQELQAAWRAVGPLRVGEDHVLWREFRKAADQVWGRVRERDTARHQEQVANLDKKRALIAQAEEFAARAEAAMGGHTGLLTAQDIARKARSLQEEFRTIGFVPRAEVETVRTAFQAACDRIWATIREEQEAELAQQRQNLEAKQALIRQVEEILADENPHYFREEVARLSAQWRTIGPVPRDQAQDIRRRFDELTRRAQAPR